MMISETILTYKLTDAQFQTLDKAVLGYYNLSKTESIDEILNINYFIVIINLDLLPLEESRKLQRFFKEIDGGITDKLLITKRERPWTNIQNAIYFEEYEKLLPRAQAIFDKSYKKAKRMENQIQNINGMFKILDRLSENTSVTTDELASYSGKNALAVRRFIEMLALSGIKIEYCFDEQSWKLDK